MKSASHMKKISAINCHRQPQILNLKGSFILLKGKHAAVC